MGNNSLDRLSRRKVEDFVLAHKDEIEAGKWSMTTAAAQLTAQLRRPITPGNIQGAARALSVRFSGSARGVYSNRELYTRLTKLAQFVAQLAGEMGTPVPPEIEEIGKQIPIGSHINE